MTDEMQSLTSNKSVGDQPVLTSRVHTAVLNGYGAFCVSMGDCWTVGGDGGRGGCSGEIFSGRV